MKMSNEVYEKSRVKERAALYRQQSPAFSQWAAGYGVIKHEDLTQVRVYEMADLLNVRDIAKNPDEVFQYLAAADRIASAVMWTVVHMTYAQKVYLDGRDLEPEDFKLNPDGHTGGSLNMVPAYLGYLVINAITGITRSWLMGQGHCVAAIDAANVIVGNMTAAHAERYELSDKGLTRLVRDFYSYKVRFDGRPEAPLGSHVNAYTAGGLVEGGYLGFAELSYVHMPLPGEHLVVFLSDGAFEEQRGSDWAPRWWRAEDSGVVAPIMIANGRRIDQRTTLSQRGGVSWFRDHLRLNEFDPVDIDGRDPAAFAWAIFEMEEKLTSYAKAASSGDVRYPVPLPYAIAEAPKGFGFPGAGTNIAHNLPLGANPALDADARNKFNVGGRQLWVPLPQLKQAVSLFNNHEKQGRVRERDNALASRDISLPELPEPPWRNPTIDSSASPMEGLDVYFCSVIRENPDLRPRVGNPDELRSNRMNATLDLLKHRVTSPETGVAEAMNGAVITALNEEAVACAAFANRGGINLIVTYEAFAPKMLGAVRQEIIFARNQLEAGAKQKWLSVPLVLSSHTWENGKNEQSHQDPTMCEALMTEMSDISRVVFPADWNSAVSTFRAAYATHGEIWTLVVSKQKVPDFFTSSQAQQLVETGAITLSGDENSKVLLVAVGSYQLIEALRASDRLKERGVPHSVIYLFEPGKFRSSRDSREAAYTNPPEVRESLFPPDAKARVFLTHTRPEVLLSVVRPIDTGGKYARALGYINRGGTFNVQGMLFANRCTWAHAVAAVAEGLGRGTKELLSKEELKAIRGETDPIPVLFQHS